MGYAIPVKVYERLEDKIGKEAASIIVEALEESIKCAFEEAKQEQKVAISEELKKELASKYDIEVVKKEIDVVRKEIDVLRKEIELVRLELKKDLKIITIILLAAIIILNQNSLEFLARILGLLK